MSKDTYLGDGLYHSYDGFHHRLYAYDGVSITNQVFLDPYTLHSFLMKLKEMGYSFPSTGSGLDL